MKRLLRLVLGLSLSTSIQAAPFVAIDVGHSTAKPGSRSAAGIPEFFYNKQLALAVIERLAASGVGAKLINGDGTVISLPARTMQARGAALFVSIHHDSVQPQFFPVVDQRFSGFSVWVSRKNIAYAASVHCALRVANHLLAAGFVPSQYHADQIPGENRPVIDAAHGIFANDDLVVLKTAQSPALLIEAGVIVNPRDEAQLRDPEVAKRQSTAIAVAIQGCGA